MSSPLNISLTDNGISQSFIYEKQISVNSHEDKILISFRIDKEYHIFHLSVNECKHIVDILSQNIDIITYNQ